MGRSNMPKGVLLLAVVWFLIGGSLVLIAGLFAMAPATLQSWGFRPSPGTSVRLCGLGFFGGTGALAAGVGSGLWRLKRWARRFVILNATSTLFGIVMSLWMGRLEEATPQKALFTSANVILLGAALWYLQTASVRRQFGRSPHAAHTETDEAPRW